MHSVWRPPVSDSGDVGFADTWSRGWSPTRKCWENNCLTLSHTGLLTREQPHWQPLVARKKYAVANRNTKTSLWLIWSLTYCCRITIFYRLCFLSCSKTEKSNETWNGGCSPSKQKLCPLKHVGCSTEVQLLLWRQTLFIRHSLYYCSASS